MRCSACGRGYAAENGIFDLTLGSTSPPGYDPHYFHSLPLVEEKHFWFVARRQTILERLRHSVPDLGRRRLFDIGCGSGGLLAFLGASGVPLAGGCDAYLDGLRLARRRVGAPLVLVDEGRHPPLAPGQSFLGLFDVLEHIDDDRGTLAWIRSVLEPGGILALTVPAHPALYDEMDRRAHHRRRYRRRELREKLETAGFDIRALTHFMAPLVPARALMRSVSRVRRGEGRPAGDEAEFRVVPVLNDALGMALGLERALLRLCSLPFGTSLLAIASRRP